MLTLSCSDRQALDLFSGRGSLIISLVRILRMGAHTTDEDEGNLARSDNTFTSNVGKGIYWPSEDENLQSETRKLIGEIPVTVDLMPSFMFPRVAIRVRAPVAGFREMFTNIFLFPVSSHPYTHGTRVHNHF